MIAVFGLGLLFVGSLLGMHTYFMIFGWTSWEMYRAKRIWYLRGHKGDKSPFDLGVWRNVKSVFCRRARPTEWTMLGLSSGPAPDVGTDELSSCF